MINFREYKNVGISYVIYIVGAVLALILQILLARFMGAYQYGIYSFILASLTIISLIPRFGQDTILTRYISEYLVKKQWGELRGILSFSYSLSVYISVSLIVLLFIAVNVFQLKLDFNINILKLGLIGVPIICLAKFNQSSIQSLKKPGLSLLGNLIISPLLVIAGSVAAYYTSAPVAEILIWIYCLSIVLSHVVMICVLEKLLSGVPDTNTRIYKKREWIIAAVPLFISSGLNVLLGRIDILMLGFLADSREVGIYTIASLIATPISFILIAINNILAPEISSLYQLGKTEELQEQLSGYMRIALVVTVPVVLFIFAAGHFILLLFGPVFAEGYIALLILTVGQFLNVFMGSVGVIMSMTNRQRLSAIILTFAVVVNILLNFVLIPDFGKVGASVATALTVILWNYLMYLHISKSLLINPTAMPVIRRYLKRASKRI